MKKRPCSSAEFISQFGIKLVRCLVNFNLTIRLVASLLVCVLLILVFLFNPVRQTSARTKLSSPLITPVSEAPQPFVFSSNVCSSQFRSYFFGGIDERRRAGFLFRAAIARRL